jgi:hypothetical protein
MENTSFTAVDIQSLNERISILETTVMELQIPWYKKYSWYLRVGIILSIIIIIVGGIAAAFGVTNK